ncbi:DUF1990 domain-containing protein [Deinococcus sp. Marseille-Q6407]|uniref:DUF1990 domain-containing protein n=1 Tax=Deinococcus sp. Marseille-Q6407 TaxID=2969223 RepID=UPI0021C14B4F|nr:DUF1990 domain-containing protein [Deinococcus sp. Marseille-Q6407]
MSRPEHAQRLGRLGRLGRLEQLRRPLSPEEQRRRLYERQKYRLDQYTSAKPNFDPTRLSEYTADTGWHVDDYEQDLMPESPGDPWPDGSFQAAQQVLSNYTFPPPDLITGIFTPDTPLEDRIMVLRGRFLIFTFWFGVKVNQVVDEVRALPDGSHEAVWGYSYQTLEGHYEMGQIDFTVHKALETGRVTFRIHAVSRTGKIANPIYRLGFRMFGRYLQRRFAYSSMRRLKQQVGEMLREGRLTPPPSQTPVQPAESGDLPPQVEQHIDQQTGSHLSDGDPTDGNAGESAAKQN